MRLEAKETILLPQHKHSCPQHKGLLQCRKTELSGCVEKVGEPKRAPLFCVWFVYGGGVEGIGAVVPESVHDSRGEATWQAGDARALTASCTCATSLRFSCRWYLQLNETDCIF